MLEQIAEEVGVGRAWSFAELAGELGIAERKLRGIARGAQRPCLDEALDIASTLSVPRHGDHRPRNAVSAMLAAYDWGGAHKLDGAAPHPLEAAASATEFATEILKAHSPASRGGTAFVSDERRDALARLDVLIAMATTLRHDLANKSP